MDETTANDLRLDMPKNSPPAASSHNAVELSLENKSGSTGAAAALHGFCFRVHAAKWRLCTLLLLLLFLVVVVSVPSLKRIKVLGLPLWKWTVAAALVIVSYHYISLLGRCIVKKLFRKMKEDKSDVVYYADGLRGSVNNVMFCVFILLSWEHYFRPSRHGLRQYGVKEKALDIGTWTAVSLLVGAFLLLAMNTVILSWESHAINRRFTDNIGKAGRQLYFLGLVSGSKFDIFSPRKEGEGKGAGEAMNMPAAEENNEKQGGGNEKENEVQKKKKREKADKFLSRNSELNYASTYRKKKVAKYFIEAARLSSRKDDTIPEEIRKQWERFKQQDDSEYITRNSMTEIVGKDNVESVEKEINILFKELIYAYELKGKEHKDQNSSSKDRIRYSTFEEWMTEAFRNCLLLGYTLNDAKGAMNNLNNIKRVIVSIVVILCWLLLVGNVPSKVLVVVASTFAAITFIFKGILKAMVEGIFFASVAHSFIVGDLCIIDDTQLEVKRIDALKTTFHKINTKDEVSYPNKVLAKKKICHLKRSLAGRDCVELSFSQSVDINSLKNKITKFIDKNNGKFKEGPVVTNIAIHFNACHEHPS